MKKYIIYLTIAVFFAIIGYIPLYAETYDFTLEDTDGNLFTLSENLGEGPVLLNFWATWCTPCKQELPHLQELHEKYGNKGLKLISISEDSPKSQFKIKPYLRSKRLTFQTLLDLNGEVLRLFHGKAIPYQVLVDKNGEIVESHQGYNPGDEKVLEEKIKKLLDNEMTND